MGWLNDECYVYSPRTLENIAKNYIVYCDYYRPWMLDYKIDFDMALKKLPRGIQKGITDFMFGYNDMKLYDRTVYQGFRRMAQILNGGVK